MSFELFFRYWNPHQVGEVNSILSASMETPDWLEPEESWCWFLMTSPSTSQKNVQKLIRYNPRPHLGFKKPFILTLAPWISCLAPEINTTLYFTTVSVGRLALLHRWGVEFIWTEGISGQPWFRKMSYLSLSTERMGSNDAPGAMSTVSAQILV